MKPAPAAAFQNSNPSGSVPNQEGPPEARKGGLGASGRRGGACKRQRGKTEPGHAVDRTKQHRIEGNCTCDPNVVRRDLAVGWLCSPRFRHRGKLLGRVFWCFAAPQLSRRLGGRSPPYLSNVYHPYRDAAAGSTESTRILHVPGVLARVKLTLTITCAPFGAGGVHVLGSVESGKICSNAIAAVPISS